MNKPFFTLPVGTEDNNPTPLDNKQFNPDELEIEDVNLYVGKFQCVMIRPKEGAVFFPWATDPKPST